MFAIYKKELKSYFSSVIACLFIAATLALVGLYFTAYTLLSGYASMSYSMSNTMFLLLIAVPILTMGSIAQERKQKTDQLLITAPVSIWKIVLGKYLALLTIFAIPVAIVCCYPVMMCLFGEIPLSECYLSILAYFMFGAACVAIGMFVSSLTESSVIAAVLGFVVLFIGYMMSSICSLISSDGNILTDILGCYDLTTRTENFFNGIFDLPAVIYYITIIALFLFLTCQSIQKRRWSMSVKNISTGVFNSAFIAVAVVITIVINMIIGAIPETYTTFDMTSDKLYSITEDTEEVLDALEDDITIYVLIAEASADSTLDTTLSRYDEYSSHISVEYKDTTTYPTFYADYTDSSPTSNSMIIVNETTGASSVVDYSDIYEYEIDYTTYSYSVTGYDAEGLITSAISYVSSEDLPTIYVITGHGESDLDSGMTEIIEKENISYEEIYLMDYDDVPEDAAAIIINGPTSDFSEDDASKVISYLEAGGNAIIITQYTDEDMDNFADILAAYGMSVVDGLVVEGNSSYYYQSQLYLLPEVQSTDLTDSIYGQYYVFAPYVQGIITEEQDEESTLSLTTLLNTSDDAYSKVDLNSESAEMEDGDIEGPFDIAVYAENVTTDEETSEEITTKVAVIGCVYLFTESAAEMVSDSNLLLFTSIANEMVDVELTTSIAAKSYSASTVTISTSNAVIIGVLVAIVMPVIILILGIVVWAYRRRK